MRAHHTGVFGDSGGGKTTFMREMHTKFTGLSIWVNHNGESNISGKRCRGKKAMLSADDARLNLICDDVNDGTRMAREVGQEYHKRTGYGYQVIVDEAQESALPDGSSSPDTPLKRMLHQDRSDGGKAVVATQDPTDLHYTPLKQVVNWVWVGEWSPFHEGFLRYFSIPTDELPNENYRYVVFDKQMNFSYRGETKSKFG